MIVQVVLGLAAMGLNIWYWWHVMRHWDGRLRRWCERRYGVVITIGFRGAWQVSGARRWYRRLAIELLPLAYFMSAFLAWAVGMVLVIVVMSAILE